MKRKLSVFLLAVVMLLSICPIASANTTTVEPYLLDLHIEGNLVSNEIIRAVYTIPDECNEIIDETKTKETIKWGANTNHGSLSGITPAVSALAENEKYGYDYYTVPSANYSTSNRPHMLFFTVTPTTKEGTPAIKDEKGNAVTLYSPILSYIKTDYPDQAWVQNVSIAPISYPGTMYVGDTVVANFTYYAPEDCEMSWSGCDNEDPTVARNTTHVSYEWYTSDERVAASTFTVDDIVGTNRNYTIKNVDSGKWLYCKITPKYKGTPVTAAAVWAVNHVGNVLLGDIVKTTPADYGFRDTFYDWGRFLGAEKGIFGKTTTTGSTLDWNARRALGVMTHYRTGTTESVTFDAGKVVPFDAVGFYKGTCDNTSTLTNPTLSYSMDNENWTDVLLAASYKTGRQDIPISQVKYARYFKYSAKGSSTSGGLENLYPYLRTDAKLVTSSDENVVVEGNKITVKVAGMTLAQLDNVLTKATYSGGTVNTSFVIASPSEETAYLLEEDTTANVDTNDEIGNNISNTYLKVTAANDVNASDASKTISTYYKIVADVPNDVVVSETTTDANLATVSNANNTVTVKTWNAPLDEVAKAITSTSSTDDTDISETFVYGTEVGGVVKEIDAVDAANTRVNEATNSANIYMKVVGKAGVSVFYKVIYTDVYTGTTYTFTEGTGALSQYLFGSGTYSLPETSNSTMPYFNSKYLLSTELTIPEGYSVGIGARTGRNNAYFMYDALWFAGDNTTTIGTTTNNTRTLAKAVDANSIVNLNINIPNVANKEDVFYGYIPGKTYKLEMLFDFSNVRSNEGGNSAAYPLIMPVSAWIDGVQVYDKVSIYTKRDSGATYQSIFSPYITVIKNAEIVEEGSSVTCANTTFKKVWFPEGSDERAEIHHAVEAPKFALKAGETAVETLATGTNTYSLTYDANVYYGENYTTFLVAYEKDGNTLKLADIATGTAGTAATLSVNVTENTVIKAFVFANDYNDDGELEMVMYPNAVVGEWTVQ